MFGLRNHVEQCCESGCYSPARLIHFSKRRSYSQILVLQHVPSSDKVHPNAMLIHPSVVGDSPCL